MEDVPPIEIEFLNQAGLLPDEYIEYFLPPLNGRALVPARNQQVGDLEVRIFQPFLVVRVGDHTEARFGSVRDTLAYVNRVLTDQLVFHFHEEGVDYFNFEDFKRLDEADYNYHVWSGPFRYAFLNKQGFF